MLGPVESKTGEEVGGQIPDRDKANTERERKSRG